MLCVATLLALAPCLQVSASPGLQANPDPDAGRPVVLALPDGVDTISGGAPVQLVLDDGVAEAALSDAGQFIWFNRFTPDPADFPFKLEEIQVVFGSSLVNVGDAVDLVIFEDTDGDGDPGTGSVHLATFNEVIQFADDATFSVYSLATPVVLGGPGDVIIGVINRYSSEGLFDFPARLDESSSAVRSWAASYLAGDVPDPPFFPADEQWGTVDSFGFPGNWVVRGFGTTLVPVEVPTFSSIGLALLVVLLAGSAWLFLRRRSAA